MIYIVVCFVSYFLLSKNLIETTSFDNNNDLLGLTVLHLNELNSNTERNDFEVVDHEDENVNKSNIYWNALAANRNYFNLTLKGLSRLVRVFVQQHNEINLYLNEIINVNSLNEQPPPTTQEDKMEDVNADQHKKMLSKHQDMLIDLLNLLRKSLTITTGNY